MFTDGMSKRYAHNEFGLQLFIYDLAYVKDHMKAEAHLINTSKKHAYSHTS